MKRLRDMTIAGLVGGGLGAGACAGSLGVRAALGSAPGAETEAAVLVAVGFVVGVSVRGRPGLLGPCLAGAGLILGILGGWTAPLGGVLARLGGSLDGGPVGIAFARMLGGGVALVPLGALLGQALRQSAGRLAPPSLAALAIGAGVGALGVSAARLGGSPWMLPGGGALLALAGILLAVRRQGDADDAAPGRPDLGAIGVGFGVAAFAFLAPAPFRFAFGHELPGLPVVATSLAAGLAVGALLAAGVAHFAPRLAGAAAAAAAIAAGSAAAIVGLGPLDAFSITFLESIESVPDLAGVVDAAFGLVLTRVAAVGAGLGAGAVLLLVAAPADAAARISWATRTGIGAALGAAAGTWFARFAPGSLSLQDVIVGAGIGAAGLTGLAAVIARGPIAGRAVGVAGVALVVILGTRLPEPDLRNMLPDRQFATGRQGIRQRGWIMFEQDGPNESAAVIRRGRARRLLVDGRIEATNGLATRAGGILGHLPLAMHPAPARVLLLGVGNGAALASVLAHPAERVDAVERGPALVEAARRFGDDVGDAIDDGRVRLRLGDPEDLVARAGRYDVVLQQIPGTWSETSSRLSTREFLESVRDRLEDGGLYARWLPDVALTKAGFQTLLATTASVFPQVEVWGANGSSVVILAKKNPAPHDFAAILTAYRTPGIQASAASVWIAEPLSLISQFLVSDETVRRISKQAPIHSRRDNQLGRVEAERRRQTGTVNPVPGLFALDDDILARFINTPPAGFDVAVANARQSRALELAALGHEVQRGGPSDTRALDAWEAAFELNPQDRALRRRLADLRSRMGIEFTNRQSALAAYTNLQQAVDLDPTYAEGFANLGRHLAMSDEYEFAVAVTEHAVEMEPDNDLFALLLAQIWKRRAYYDNALPWYEKAMKLNPRNVAAAVGYVDTKLVMETNPDLEHGLEISRHYLELEPENDDLRSRIAKLELALERQRAGLPLEEGAPDSPAATAEPDSAATNAEPDSTAEAASQS